MIRIAITALALCSAALAQAAEGTQWTIAPGSASRAAVAAEARNTPPTNELYDGRVHDPAAPVATKSRDEVRAEAIAAQRMRSSERAILFLGGV